MSASLAAKIFGGLVAMVILFQLALALGAPWGGMAMGGAFPGVYPPPMRLAAVLQAFVLGGFGLVVLARAGLVVLGWRPFRLAWLVVALMALGVILNVITPSPLERAIWVPVTILMFVSSLRVAVSRVIPA